MAAHAPTVPRRSHWLQWLTWSFLLVPLIQLALVTQLRLTESAYRPVLIVLEGLVLWWAGSCSILAALAHKGQADGKGWLLLAAMLFAICAVQLLFLRSAATTSFVDLGLALGLGLSLLLSVTALTHRAIRPESGLTQAVFDALCLVSGALVIQASVAPLAQDIAPTLEPSVPLSVLHGFALVVAVAAAVSTRPREATMHVPLFIGLGCGIGASILATFRADLADPVATPLRTLSWGLIAVAAITAHARRDRPQQAPARPTLTGFVAPLLPWTVIALALVTIQATATVPAELLALTVSGTTREVIAALRRHVREDDLVLALLWERHRLSEERTSSASRLRTIARVVHDLTAPLNGVRVVQHTLQDQDLPEATKLRPHIELLAVLINNLRDLVRGKSPSLRRIGIDTYEVANVSLDTILERAEIAGIQTAIDVKTAGWWIMADRAAVERILDNLLTNALDIAPRGSAIKIVLSDDQEHPTMLTISVIDEGPGICEHEVASIFEPKPLKREGNKMGLGLSIVRELAEGMGGACGMTRADKGSSFWVRLPRADRLALNEKEKEDHGDLNSGR